MRHDPVLIGTIAAILFIGTVIAGTAHAYPIATGTSGLNVIVSSTSPFLTPFENFFKNINSVTVVGPSVGVQAIPQNDVVMNGIQSGFQKFDAWLYGIAGFHISGFLTAFLGMFSWLLGFVKRGVDWILSAVH